MTREELIELGIHEDMADSVMALYDAAIAASQNESTARLNKLQQEMDEMKLNNSLLVEIGKYKPHDPELLLHLIDRNQVKVDETGLVTGLDEQMKALKESKGYLFADVPTPTGGIYGANAQIEIGSNDRINGMIRGY